MSEAGGADSQQTPPATAQAVAAARRYGEGQSQQGCAHSESKVAVSSLTRCRQAAAAKGWSLGFGHRVSARPGKDDSAGCVSAFEVERFHQDLIRKEAAGDSGCLSDAKARSFLKPGVERVFADVAGV